MHHGDDLLGEDQFDPVPTDSEGVAAQHPRHVDRFRRWPQRIPDVDVNVEVELGSRERTADLDASAAVTFVVTDWFNARSFRIERETVVHDDGDDVLHHPVNLREISWDVDAGQIDVTCQAPSVIGGEQYSAFENEPGGVGRRGGRVDSAMNDRRRPKVQPE